MTLRPCCKQPKRHGWPAIRRPMPMCLSRFTGWLRTGPDEQADPFMSVPGTPADRPDRMLETDEAMAGLEDAVRGLPARQQQAFMLRCLEGLDTAATAAAMGCSEGSVKTHYSRAIHALRAKLGEHWHD